MARLVRRHGRRRRSAAGPVPDAAAARPGPRAARRAAGPDHHRLHQHHPHRGRAVLPRRRGDRAPLPGVDPVERGDHGAPRPAPGHRRRRPHLHLRVLGQPVRGRLQPFLPRQEPSRRRRPGLLPGPRLPRHVRQGVPGGPAVRPTWTASGRRSRTRRRHAVLPAPPADAGLLGVPDGVHGPRPDERHPAGPVQPLSAPPRPQGHLRPARLGLPGRRRNGRGGVARPDPRRRAGRAGQPDLRHQLQSAAAGRSGPRQRQDHPGAGGVLPRRRLERHQGDLGPGVGSAAARRPGRRAGEPDEHHRRRRLPDLQGQRRRLRPGALLRPRPADQGDGRRR